MFQTLLPFQSHSATSKEAAEKNTTATQIRDQIRRMIKASGFVGLTNDEISAQYNKTGSMFSPRLIELERDGSVVKLAQTRTTRSGRQANIYVCPEYIDDRDVLPVKQQEKLTPQGFQYIYNSWARKKSLPMISVGDAGDLLSEINQQGFLK